MASTEEKPLLVEPAEKKRTNSWRAGLLLSVILTMYTMSIMSTIPLQSQYVHARLLRERLNSSNISTTPASSCNNATVADMDVLEEVQEDTARRLLFYTLSGAIPAIFVNLVFGSYSDFLGRKILFLLPLCGDFFKNLLYCLIIKYNWNMSLFYLGNGVSGLCGSFTTMLLACFSFTADLTPPEKSRTVAIALIEAILAIAASAGSMATGYLIALLGYFYPALLITIIMVCDILVVVMLLPETLKKPREFVLSPFVHLKKCFGFFTVRGSGLKRAQYNLCMVIMFFSIISLIGRTSIETLFQLGVPFCWDSIKIGYFGALRIIIQTSFSVAAIKLLQPCLSDEVIAIVGMLSGAASLALEAFSTADWMLYIVPVVGIIAYTTTPIFRSFMSRMTSPKEQGALFSSIAAMETVCTTVSVTLYNTVYESTVGTMKGAVFLLMSGFCVLTVILVLVFMVVSRGSRVAYELYIPDNDILSSNGSIQESGKRDRKSYTT